jgi:hypothetical protein
MDVALTSRDISRSPLGRITALARISRGAN